jgi:hypothetical protein
LSNVMLLLLLREADGNKYEDENDHPLANMNGHLPKGGMPTTNLIYSPRRLILHACR